MAGTASEHSDNRGYACIALTLFVPAGRPLVERVLGSGMPAYHADSGDLDALLTSIGRICRRHVTPAHYPPDTHGQAGPGASAQRGTDGDMLTPRERQVLTLIAAGHTSKQIARRLEVTPQAVYKTRRRVMVRLGLTSEADLIKYAISAGLALAGMGPSVPTAAWAKDAPAVLALDEAGKGGDGPRT